MTEPTVRVVDASEPRAGGDQRGLTQVAVGVLFQADGRILNDISNYFTLNLTDRLVD